jgi:putative aldouronate transport system permease protein
MSLAVITPAQKAFRLFNYIFLILTCVICFIPFVNLLAISFSSSAPVNAGMVVFMPIDFTLVNYQFALTNGKFFSSFMVSVERVILGVVVNLFFMICAAYPLSKTKEKLRLRNVYMVYFAITMIIGGGLIPTYILISNLKLINTIWALILPGALPVWTMVILMNFIRQLPQDIEEAAMMDGAGVFSRLLRIMLPLLKPALATVGLFCIVGHWNDWFGGIIYINRPERYPLQSYLHTLLLSFDEIMRIARSDYAVLLAMMSARTGRAAQLFLGALPMMLIYPVLQKYFTTGLVMGSVKG